MNVGKKRGQKICFRFMKIPRDPKIVLKKVLSGQGRVIVKKIFKNFKVKGGGDFKPPPSSLPKLLCANDVVLIDTILT